MSKSTNILNPRYGVIIGLFKDTEVYLSRRSEKHSFFPKKWQFTNDKMRGSESSIAGAIRVVDEQTGIALTRDRLHDLGSISIEELGDFYYVYLVHLKGNETPTNTDENKTQQSEWRLFPMTRAVVLDVVPCIRNILSRLDKCLNIVDKETLKGYSTETEIPDSNTVYEQNRQAENARILAEHGWSGSNKLVERAARKRAIARAFEEAEERRTQQVLRVGDTTDTTCGEKAKTTSAFGW